MNLNAAPELAQTISPWLMTIAAELGIPDTLPAARGLRVYQEASHLVVAERGRDGRDYLLDGAAAQAWRMLKAAAERDGISVVIVSAFRSIERQAEIIRARLVAGANIADVLTSLAPPGFSEHHSGRAVDISTPGVGTVATEFADTLAFAWLVAHAGEYRYSLSYPVDNAQGYQYEPWHWCYHDAGSVID